VRSGDRGFVLIYFRNAPSDRLRVIESSLIICSAPSKLFIFWSFSKRRCEIEFGNFSQLAEANAQSICKRTQTTHESSPVFEVVLQLRPLALCEFGKEGNSEGMSYQLRE
jgi:hypothetical protein